jgi:hypothetical protein
MASEAAEQSRDKDDTTAVSSYFGAFPGFLSFPQVPLFQ